MKLKITLLFFAQLLFFQEISAQCTGADFEEKNGIAILEMEAKTAGSWRIESSSGASAGKTLAYRGNNSFSAPGSSVVTYSIKINSPGTYRFIWRNKIGVIASHNAATEHNDSWLKINASNFYGQQGSSRIYPGGSGKFPVPNGASSGGYFKIYTNNINWSWSTWTSDNDGHFVYAQFNSAGVYTIQVSGRSNGHFVDRMVLYKEASYSLSQAQNLSLSQTNCSGGSTTPPPPPPTSDNIAPTVSFTSLSEGQSFAVGSTISVGVSANDSDGSIVKHQIYVNNSLVDTDGSGYTPHKITNTTVGNYAIKVVATDNEGATATAIVNVVVGDGGSTTPPPPPTSGNTAPSVSFSNLSEGQSFAVGSTISVGVSASDPGGSVVKHQIFVNNVLVDTDGSGYTPHKITNVTTGNYAIKVVVTDNEGATATATVNVVVGDGGSTTPPPTSGNTAPLVSFTNLSEGQSFEVGSTISVGVSANDSDGSIVKHQIYVNNSLVDTDGSGYTPHKITNTTVGNYAIKVVATDNEGATAMAIVNVVVGDGGSTTPPPPSDTAVSFTLVNSLTNGNITLISNGSTITANSNVNINATTSLNAKSMILTLSGASNASRVENFAPYALFGDVSGNYLSGFLNNGSHTLKADVFSGSNGTGSMIGTTSVNFTVGGSNASKTSVVYAYPNPVLSDGKVTVKLPAGASDDILYSVTNSSGIQVEKGKVIVGKSQDSADLQLSKVGNQVPGVYYLILQSNKGIYSIPLVKE